MKGQGEEREEKAGSRPGINQNERQQVKLEENEVNEEEQRAINSMVEWFKENGNQQLNIKQQELKRIELPEQLSRNLLNEPNHNQNQEIEQVPESLTPLCSSELEDEGILIPEQHYNNEPCLKRRILVFKKPSERLYPIKEEEKYFKFKSLQDVITVDLQKIKDMPLYCIEHNAQFFRMYPTLAKRLKAEKILSKYYVDHEGISLVAYQEGLGISQHIDYTGMQLQEIMLVIFLTAYRHLQKAMTQVCKKGIVRVENDDLNIVFKLMINIKRWDDKDMQSLWMQAILYAYDFEDEMETEDIQKLYTFILDVIDNQNANNKDWFYGDEYRDDRFQWNEQKEGQLCELFLKSKTAHHTYIEFKELYPEQISFGELRLRFEKIIKTSLSMLEVYFKKKEIDSPHPLFYNENDYRVINRDPRAMEFRRLLITVYQRGEIYLEDLKQATAFLRSILVRNAKRSEESKRRDGNAGVEGKKGKRQSNSESNESDSHKQAHQEKVLTLKNSLANKKPGQIEPYLQRLRQARRTPTEETKIVKIQEKTIAKGGSQRVSFRPSFRGARS